MEIIGKIIQVLESRGGVSAKTGTPWKVQSYVLETEEQYPRRMVFDVFGEDKIAIMNIQQGQVLKVSFDIDAREYQGRWFNSIRAWKVEPPTPEAPAAQPAAPAAPAYTEAPTAPFGSDNDSEGSVDNLPF